MLKLRHSALKNVSTSPQSIFLVKYPGWKFRHQATNWFIKTEEVAINQSCNERRYSGKDIYSIRTTQFEGAAVSRGRHFCFLESSRRA